VLNDKRVALVTGGGKGIGRAVCIRLAADGMAVVVADIDLENACQTANIMKAAGNDSTALWVDVSNKESVDIMFDRLLSKYGRINYLAAMAQVNKLGDFLTFSLSDWEAVMETNVDGTLLCCQRAAKEMLKQGQDLGPCSIGIGLAQDAFEQTIDSVAFGTSNWTVRGLMRSLALSLAQDDITVNAVGQGENIRFEEIASIYSFLFSDEARNITGTTIMDNYGATMI
jgi:NAD(P)-dependent dehydrogenase (short-subunit alcohol dehydrogenase family)